MLSGLAILLELLFIFNSSIEVLVVLVFSHLFFLILGLILAKRHDWLDLFLLDSIKLRRERVVREYALENLTHASILLLVLPSITSHILGLALLVPKVRDYVTNQIWPDII